MLIQKSQAWSLLAKVRCQCSEGQQSQSGAETHCVVHSGAWWRAEAMVMKLNGQGSDEPMSEVGWGCRVDSRHGMQAPAMVLCMAPHQLAWECRVPERFWHWTDTLAKLPESNAAIMFPEKRGKNTASSVPNHKKPSFSFTDFEFSKCVLGWCKF